MQVVSARSIARAIRISDAPLRSKSCRRKSCRSTSVPRRIARHRRAACRRCRTRTSRCCSKSARTANSPISCSSSCRGSRLRSLIRPTPLNVRRVIDFAHQPGDGLADAHAAGLIHGDIRPDTIMITPKDRAKFMNFGLSRFTRRRCAPAPDGHPVCRAGRARRAARRFAKRHLLAGRGDVRDADGAAACAWTRAACPQPKGACRARADGRPHARGERRAHAQKRRGDCGRASQLAAILDTRTEAAEAAEAAAAPRRRAAAARRPRRARRRAARAAARSSSGGVRAMIIETRAVPPFQKNGYVVACETTREAVVIDPGDEVDALLHVRRRVSRCTCGASC